MAENNAKHVAEEIEEIEGTEEGINPTRWQRFKNWFFAHKVQLGIGTAMAAFTGIGLVARKVVRDKTGVDLGTEVVETIEEITPPEI